MWPSTHAVQCESQFSEQTLSLFGKCVSEYHTRLTEMLRVLLFQECSICGCVRGKSHWKSSRWFLPFFVSYRSIAVGCELSLHPEMRTYKNDVRRYCVGFVALWLCWDVLDPQSRRLQWSALSGRSVRLQGPELLVLPHRPFCVLWMAPRFASRHGIKR